MSDDLRKSAQTILLDFESRPKHRYVTEIDRKVMELARAYLGGSQYRDTRPTPCVALGSRSGGQVVKLKNEVIGQKCTEIVTAIVKLCDDCDDKRNPQVAFYQDWGGNSVTVEIAGRGHSHAGMDDGSFDDLVDQLHGMFCGGSHLSFVASKGD